MALRHGGSSEPRQSQYLKEVVAMALSDSERIVTRTRSVVVIRGQDGD